ncbi:MAG: proton-conducting transporter membrane subunit [Candidatus Ozemobacteraceae bacterium]
MNLVAIAWFFLFVGSAFGLFGRPLAVAARRPAALFQAVGCLALTIAGFQGLNGLEWEYIPTTLPHLGPLVFGMDRLSGLFLLLLGLLGFSTSLFASGYLEHLEERWNFHWLPLLNGLFIFSMSGVFLARHTLVFLLFWELMALASFGLVVLESWQERNRRTGFMYLAITHLGAALLFLGLLWPCATNGLDFRFAGWFAGVAGLSIKTRMIIFAALFLGFATKAGLVPMHVWLPRAHPQAPAHVSALMSGIMIKTGVYGMMRFFIVSSALPAPAAWGWLLVITGITSALLAVLYALNEQQLKALLAYSSIENIGIIFMALGLGLLFRTEGSPALAQIAFTAALLHSANHALFKGLLFMGAGAIQYRSHTLNLDELGGLARGMPLLSMLFFVGAIAMSGLPPTNGFMGEWLVYRSLIAGFSFSHLSWKLILPLIAALLALTGALAAAAAVKSFGCAFLGRPKIAHLHTGPDPDRWMLAGMGFPAFLCLLLGVMPELLSQPIAAMIAEFGYGPAPTTVSGLVWPQIAGSEGLQPLLIVTLLTVGILAAWILVKRCPRGTTAARVPETVDTWNCSTPLTARMSYTGSSFSEPFLVNFALMFSPQRRFRTHGPLSPLLSTRMTYTVRVRKIFEDFLYRPTLAAVLRLSHVVQGLQAGSLQVYLALMFLALIGLLIVGR